MRRVPFAVLASMMIVVAPLIPPLDAGALGTGSPAVGSPAGHASSNVSPAVRHRIAVRAATHRVLVSFATSMRVSVGQLRSEWQHVATCEVGGNWAMVGPQYSGIGFLNSTWNQFGGTQFAPLAGQATIDQQILVGMRITRSWVPDQFGCSRTGW